MDSDGTLLPTERRVLCNFPKKQYRPVVIEIGYQVHIIKSIPKPRWNWALFSKTLDNNIPLIPPITENYNRFVKLTIGTANKSIPRRYREAYISDGILNARNLKYGDFKLSSNREDAKKILTVLNKQR